LRGFILGWGAYATGTRIARQEIAARGPGQAALAVVSTLRRALLGAGRRALRRGVATRILRPDTGWRLPRRCWRWAGRAAG
jgi:hypothetical protein